MNKLPEDLDEFMKALIKDQADKLAESIDRLIIEETQKAL
jgi:hypothetical protein